jgi:hypothetical protein
MVCQVAGGGSVIGLRFALHSPSPPCPPLPESEGDGLFD